MKRSVVARLRDMLAMIEAARDLVESCDLALYQSNVKRRLAVERCVEIISEASRHLPADDKARFSDIPWPEIAAIGNKLRHECNRVDDIILWRVATVWLPQLGPVVTAILNNDADR